MLSAVLALQTYTVAFCNAQAFQPRTTSAIHQDPASPFSTETLASGRLPAAIVPPGLTSANALEAAAPGWLPFVRMVHQNSAAAITEALGRWLPWSFCEGGRGILQLGCRTGTTADGCPVWTDARCTPDNGRILKPVTIAGLGTHADRRWQARVARLSDSAARALPPASRALLNAPAAANLGRYLTDAIMSRLCPQDSPSPRWSQSYENITALQADVYSSANVVTTRVEAQLRAPDSTITAIGDLYDVPTCDQPRHPTRGVSGP